MLQNNYQPLISIITICFNSAKTIRQTMESVLNQTYSNFEYIIVDGKSKDSTLEIIKEYEEKFIDKGIIYRYVSEPDKGIYDAMNKGINMASGEWVGIINSDDWYEVDACSTLIETLNNNLKMDIFAATVRFITESNGQEYYTYTHSSIEEIQYKMTICHPTVFIRSLLYKKKKFDTSFRIVADWDLLKYLICQGANVVIRQKVIANFRDNGASSVNNIISIMEQLKVIRQTNTLKSYMLYFLKLITLLRKVILDKIKPDWFIRYRKQQMVKGFDKCE
jgi:glycosyltransferase involved in cell wall biosynthesis